MDKYLKAKAEKLAKSMYKSTKKAKLSQETKSKTPIEDVLDDNELAEVDPDELTPNTTGTMTKGDKFVKNILNKFEEISLAYLKKQKKSKD